jgi:hypothetical protein
MPNIAHQTAPTGALNDTPQPNFSQMFGEFARFMEKEQHNHMEPMKNHIIQSIIEAASMPINRSGIAAMNQLILEVTSEFPGVNPSGFGFQEMQKPGPEPHYQYAMHADLIDPWPLESKTFTGIGESVQDAMKSLRQELKAYFLPANGFVVKGIDVQTLNGESIPDRRTEFAA